jgi:hypothetical protein
MCKLDYVCSLHTSAGTVRLNLGLCMPFGRYALDVNSQKLNLLLKIKFHLVCSSSIS